ncbi:hypothetical protein MAR_021124 [Mya arenaria]|uniref:Uncharacterized protein n=1 Tax=Mya arenaria TaxID=6604 RepID=A0ABY7E9U5_MYAAR|nr:hypothetical protein MAR_021124 [Mya arenaria]
MVIVATVTPRDDKVCVVPRIRATSDDLIKIGKINIHFYKQSRNAMEMIVFKTLTEIYPDTDRSDTELLKIARSLRTRTPGWSDVMQGVQTGVFSGQSKVLYLPMINENPSDLSCIYSTLRFVSNQTRSMRPWYWKALNIVTNETHDDDIKKTVVRLSAFHAEMSFLDSIGKLMENSVYAPNTVGHMLSGKAVGRAIRGHVLVCDTLDHLLISTTLPRLQKDQMDEENDNANKDESNIIGKENYLDQNRHDALPTKSPRDNVKAMLDDLLSKKISVQDICENKLLGDFEQTYEVSTQNLRKYRTAKLWLQYMKMINILKDFIAAERMGKWQDHLQSLKRMLPYFAAAGHNLYLKSKQDALRTIETGRIADVKVNVDSAQTVGGKGLRETKKVLEVSFKRSIQAVTLGFKTYLKVDGEEISVDPQLIFQRLVTVSDNTLDDTGYIFRYELRAYQSALFDASGLLREAHKSQLAHAIWDKGRCGTDNIQSGISTVLDGGSLLQRLPWKNRASYNSM